MNENFAPLASLDDWELENDDQDLRGRTVMGSDGRAVGTVQEMLVDRDRERIAAITLSDGRTMPIEDISIRDQGIFFREGGMPASGAAAGALGATARGDMGDEARIPIVQEEIKIGKREVTSGGARVRTHVVEEPVHETVRLREEHVDIERRPVADGSISGRAADDLLRDQSVEMRATSEEAVVAKEARVTEELVMHKTAEEREQEVNATVRHTEVDVDKLGDADRRPLRDDDRRR